MTVLVHFAARDLKGRTTYVGGVGPGNRTWQLSVGDVISAIESEEWRFVTQAPDNAFGLLQVRDHHGQKFLISTPDGVKENNLDFLPPLLSPMGGAWPQSPMNWPGRLPATKIPVNRIRFLREAPDGSPMGWAEIAPVRHDVDKFLTTWDVDMNRMGRRRRAIAIDWQVPWPAAYRLTLSEVRGAQAHIPWEMLWYSGAELTPDKQRELEADEICYYTWEPGPSFFNNGGPARIPEVRFNCVFPQKFWNQNSFTIGLGYISWNPVEQMVDVSSALGGGGTSIEFKNLGVNQDPPPPPPKQVSVPCVEGKLLRAAMSDIVSAGFKIGFIISTDPVTYPYPDVDTFTVFKQDPACNTLANEHTTMNLSVQAPMLSPAGIAKLLVLNQYQQQRKLKVWSYNITAATWTDEGDIDYNASTPLEVSFDTNKRYTLYFQDDQLIGCHPSASDPHPDQCFYKGPVGLFVGDENGTTDPFIIS